ncbi:MAG TPA: hypothetical protein PKK26_13100, partial [Candidatus Wallbacteria bacterium]|nr:hypothetical protein [Candidatus Wallbacteria bacterium]
MSDEKIIRYVKVSSKKDLEANGIPFAPGTLRRWHSVGINNKIFKKLGGRLFIDLFAFQEWAEESNSEN